MERVPHRKEHPQSGGRGSDTRPSRRGDRI